MKKRSYVISDGLCYHCKFVRYDIDYNCYCGCSNCVNYRRLTCTDYKCDIDSCVNFELGKGEKLDAYKLFK